ncbi:MAG: hypothetical protein AB7F65_03625 [Dehalococcoidia bacterium]
MADGLLGTTALALGAELDERPTFRARSAPLAGPHAERPSGSVAEPWLAVMRSTTTATPSKDGTHGGE